MVLIFKINDEMTEADQCYSSLTVYDTKPGRTDSQCFNG